MINQLSQETVDEYARSALVTEQPAGTDYTQGVKVGKTIPAKWWNWLFNAITKRLGQARSDADNMLTELKNTVTDAGLTIDPTDNTQLAQASQIYAERGVSSYIQEIKKGLFKKWSYEQCAGITFPDEATVAIQELKQAHYDSKLFYLCLKFHTASQDTYRHYFSDDLLNWHEFTVPAGAELQSVDVAFYKDNYYLVYSVKDVHIAYLCRSNNGVTGWITIGTYNEYGVLGLRVAENILWFISASSQTYADVDYHSYKTSDGTNWTDAGTVFKNETGTLNVISEAIVVTGGTIIGNKYTTNGNTWNTIVSDWASSAFSNLFITAGGLILLQFNELEGAYYKLSNVSAVPVKQISSWVLSKQGPEHKILAKDTSDNKAGYTTDGATFVKFTIGYPSDVKAEFIKVGTTYILGNKKSTDLETWTDIVLPTGATIVQYSGIGDFIIAGNYFSDNAGEDWVEGICGTDPYCAVPDYISDTVTCMALFLSASALERRVTFNSINRVIGTTLYLK